MYYRVYRTTPTRARRCPGPVLGTRERPVDAPAPRAVIAVAASAYLGPARTSSAPTRKATAVVGPRSGRCKTGPHGD